LEVNSLKYFYTIKNIIWTPMCINWKCFYDLNPQTPNLQNLIYQRQIPYYTI
jgi:hypothetical protein